MAITETIEKRRLVITLGEFEAPASWHWEAVRFLRNDDNTDAAPPQNVTVPCTQEEAAAHISQAMADQATAIIAKDAAIATLTAQRDTAMAAATKVAQADADWETHVRPLVEAALS